MRTLFVSFLAAACAGTASASNLLVNGDFEAGNTGFTSQYLFSENLLPAETYAVLANPRTGNGNFANIGDHTTGDGLMLVVNGSTRNDAPFAWAQEVEVTPDTEYTFSLWAANLFGSPGVFAIRINGETVGESVTAPTAVGVWAESVRTWDSGSATSARIEIVFLSTSFGGNDTALDDFVFTSDPPVCLDPSSVPFGDSRAFQSFVAEVEVPGNSNPFLSGQPDGAATKSDSAPAQSPVFATAVAPGDVLSFGVTGSVSYAGSANPSNPPDGGFRAGSASALGIAGYTGGNTLPIDCLVGVFLGDDIPSGDAPADFSYAAEGFAFQIAAPALHQIFFIGDGLTGNGDGTRQQFVVPDGATRLFLGTSDGFGWYNNTGAFQVSICRLALISTGPRVGPTTIRFDQAAYTADLDETISGSVVIDPVPLGGLYSQGTYITVRNREGTMAGVVEPAPPAVLDFDGPLLGHEAAVDGGTGGGGIKGSARFIEQRPTLFTPTLATFTLRDLPPGLYDLTLAPWNELGPTEDIFVTGLAETLDDFITFEAATVEIIGASLPEIAASEDLRLNPQTGLIEQRLTLTNNTGRTLNGFRIFITGLPDGVVVWNAHGEIDGVPYIDIFGDIAPGESVEVVVEYYRPSRVADYSPSFEIAAAGSGPPAAGGNAPLALDLRVVRKDGAGLLVEFLSQANKRYLFEYSDDMTEWHVCLPAVEGTGQRIQWLDGGPPKTRTFPSGSRFYRITEAD